MPPIRRCRVFLIEDDEVRIERITAWLPYDIRLVVARSAGRAIGTLRVDGPSTYAGLMLDHDLQMQSAVAEEKVLSGSDLIDIITRRVDHDVPVLVHSMNASRAAAMTARLKSAGFATSYVPFEMLTRQEFIKWIDHVRDLWDDAE